MSHARFVMRFTLPMFALVATMALLLGAVPALAQTEVVLYSFGDQPDGSNPSSALVRDYQGNLYGTTLAGGTLNRGTVFKLAPSGREYILHNFGYRPDGGQPIGDLAMDSSGILYGTTQTGGSFGYGTVYSIVPPGHEKILYNFGAVAGDGQNPIGGVIRDSSGNLYGTTYAGGAGLGTVFEITGSSETQIYSFPNNFAGDNPLGGLYRDRFGNLYGTTCCGGTNLIGSVFAITATGQVIWNYGFGYGGDGDLPFSTVVGDRFGNIYGTTNGGGTYDKGTVFKVDSVGNETILYSFTGGNDGSFPARGVILDGSGNLYGTARQNGAYGQGTVFVLSPSNTLTVLHAFAGTPDGAAPNSDLIRDAVTGFIYGTTSAGGTTGNGTVYEIIP
jgi:uncharacterized repeat protein (TIGR03803 family)